jgi:hypothetical protein
MNWNLAVVANQLEVTVERIIEEALELSIIFIFFMSMNLDL